MIPKSGYRFSEKIMLKQARLERDDDSKISHPALAASALQQDHDVTRWPPNTAM
jgi:hypothetical protein